MKVERLLPTEEAHDLLDLTAELADRELAPQAAGYEERAEFPSAALKTLGRAGLLGLPYPEEFGGGRQPYEVYLQVIEELARRWLAVAEAVSVHTLACYPMFAYGTDSQRKRHLPDMVGGNQLGAYCLSEPQGGSDAAALATKARREGDEYVVDGTKAWITHAGRADFYNVFVRTGGPGAGGVSCLFVDGDTAGVVAQAPEKTMGLRASPVAQIVFDGARVPADRILGAEGGGFKIALAALDGGRLGIAACSLGGAQFCLDRTVEYMRERRQFGSRLSRFQALRFRVADFATEMEAARLMLRRAAVAVANKEPGATRLAAMAKRLATDTGFEVVNGCLQLHGGYGYLRDYPIERVLRDVRVHQILEGTNEVMRLIVSRDMLGN
jgi:alkylation response protein AidB-like acyl-CoA dehydrogenase